MSTASRAWILMVPGVYPPISMSDAPGPRVKAIEDVDAIHKRIVELREERFPGDGYKKHEPWCSYRRPGNPECNCGGGK